MILYQRKVIWIFDENIFMFFFLFFSFFFLFVVIMKRKMWYPSVLLLKRSIQNFFVFKNISDAVKKLHFFKTSENDLIYLFQQGSNDWNNKIRFFF